MTVTALGKRIAYRALDVCTGGRGVPRSIGGEQFRFPARWCRYYPSGYEPATFAFLRAHCRLGDTVIDVGAHIGLFSVLMARCVGSSGRVFSFEPTPLTRAALNETVRLNGCSRVVEVHGQAVASCAGTATFYDTGDLVSNANSLVHTERSDLGFSVETTSIDEFLFARRLSVRCLKIDAEGAEQAVLLGAQATLAACRPALALSLHPAALRDAGGSLDEVWRLLQSHRVSLRHLDHPVDERWFCEQKDLFDVQAIPSF